MSGKLGVPKRVATYDTLDDAEDNILRNDKSYGILSEDDAETYQPPSLSGKVSAASSKDGTPQLVGSNSTATFKRAQQNAVDQQLNDILRKYNDKDKIKLSQILGKYSAGLVTPREDERSQEHNDQRDTDHGDNRPLAARQTEGRDAAPLVRPDSQQQQQQQHPIIKPPLTTIVDYPTAGMVEVFGKLQTPKSKDSEIGQMPTSEVFKRRNRPPRPLPTLVPSRSWTVFIRPSPSRPR
jgi:hypothetical protein